MEPQLPFALYSTTSAPEPLRSTLKVDPTCRLCSTRFCLSTFREFSLIIVLPFFNMLVLSGQFCLTEVGHGLNAMHMETTCTLMDDGSYEVSPQVCSSMIASEHIACIS